VTCFTEEAALRLVHLTSSRFFGGPERQMLGLAKALPNDCQTVFASFGEGGRCEAFLDLVRSAGFVGRRLIHDTPHLFAARKEIAALIREFRADLLLCHGYKADLVGRPAARIAGIPVVAVSRGWTGENFKVRWYDRIDRLFLHRMDRVVCVSERQAEKVRAAGVHDFKVRVIRNAARPDAFRDSDPAMRRHMESLFPRSGSRIVLMAGRLSPDKGFHVLIDAIPAVLAKAPDARFIICGDGVQRHELERQVVSLGLKDVVVFAGFRNDLDSWMPNADLFVLPSFTEGLPNVLLEAHASGVPVVATAVGGSPELVVDGETGWLVPPGVRPALAAGMIRLLCDDSRRRQMGLAAQARVREHFTFEVQARGYLELFDDLMDPVCVAA
jgi:glycosyltransferase involved in cell wall biosynthesis